MTKTAAAAGKTRKFLAMSELQNLRTSIRNLDQKILELVKERQECSRKIGEIKAKENLPVKNYQVEKELIERNMQLASSLGLWPEMAQDLTRTLISHSVKLQDEYQSQKRRRNAHTQKEVCIIGGYGQMGMWFAEFFESFGDAVSILDTQKGQQQDSSFTNIDNLEEACQKSDIIVLATPMSVTGDLVERIAEIGTEALIFDICSLKSPLLASLKKAEEKKLRISSVHPMFGPSAKILSGRNIIICELSHSEATRMTEEIFNKTTAKVVTLPIAEHDEYMAYVLGLSHLINLLFADVLRESGYTLSDLKRIASTTFNATLDVAIPVAMENEDLYYEIQALNDFSPQLLQKVSASFAAYHQDITQKRRQDFKEKMTQARVFFS